MNELSFSMHVYMHGSNERGQDLEHLRKNVTTGMCMFGGVCVPTKVRSCYEGKKERVVWTGTDEKFS